MSPDRAEILINPFRCLMDRDFQRWLVINKVLIQSKSFDPNSDLQFQDGKSPNPAELAVLDLLVNHTGEVVTHPEIVDRLTERGEYKNTRQLSGSFFPHLRTKLEKPGSIVTINELGKGVGIESFRLRYTGVWILHYFWEHPNHSIALEDLARRIYGGTDKDDRMAVIVQMLRLREALRGSSLNLRNLNKSSYPGIYWVSSLDQVA